MVRKKKFHCWNALISWLSDYGIYTFMVFITFCYFSWYLEDREYYDISNLVRLYGLYQVTNII